MAHYSNGEMCCNKCRFNNIKALEIDHINNNGCEHRKEIKGGHIYKWLIKNNFPDGFQVLCATCNALKRIDSNLNNKAKNKYPYKDKFIVVAHYSIGEMCCRNCRYSNIKGLQVDHINGKGRQHNTSIKTSLYNWLIKNDFPEGFQILCRNCNVIKRWDNEEYANQYTKGV